MLLTVLVFLILLSVLVLVHELGHFAMAKRLGIKVEEFGFGLPPRLLGKKIGETVYSINALPIGGFVRLYGEEGPTFAEDSAGKPDDQKFEGSGIKSGGDREVLEVKGQRSKVQTNRAFYARPVWQRSAVLIAGVVMNFLLALVVLSFIFTQGVFVPTDRVHIEKVAEVSPAEVAGLKPNDIIVSIDNQTITKSDQLVAITKERLGEKITLSILRGANFAEPVAEKVCQKCEQLTVTLVPRKDYPSGEGPMGITISHFELRAYSWYQAPVQGMKESIILSWELIRGIGRTLVKLVTFKPIGQEVAGPVGIAQVTGEAVKFGKLAVFELLGLLSLNLAIINVLPFPALDGGRLLFVGIEALFGRRIKMNWERAIHQVGMAILLGLIVLVTVNDILRLLGKV